VHPQPLGDSAHQVGVAAREARRVGLLQANDVRVQGANGLHLLLVGAASVRVIALLQVVRHHAQRPAIPGRRSLHAPGEHAGQHRAQQQRQHHREHQRVQPAGLRPALRALRLKNRAQR